MDEKKTEEVLTICPKCGSPMADVSVTKTGRKLQRCSTGGWDAQTKKNTGCDFVKWFEVQPETLEEKCPKCGNPLILMTTRFGKRMKKCSTGGWDREAKKATGCTYIQWLKPSEYPGATDNGGEEFLPPEPEE